MLFFSWGCQARNPFQYHLKSDHGKITFLLGCKYSNSRKHLLAHPRYFLKFRPPPELPQSLLGRAVATCMEAFSCPGMIAVARYHVSTQSTVRAAKGGRMRVMPPWALSHAYISHSSLVCLPIIYLPLGMSSLQADTLSL